MQINRQSYEEFFLLYADGELNDAGKKAVEDFVQENPDLADEFAIIQETVFHPDESIIFQDKELLYRSEEQERKIFFIRWLRIAAAAAIVIALSLVGWLFDRKEIYQQPVAMKQTPVTPDNAPKTTPGSITTENNNSNPDININNQPIETKEIDRKNSNRSTLPDAVRTASYKRNNELKETRKETAEEKLTEPDVVLQKELPVNEIASTDVALAPIDVQVQPHALKQQPEYEPGDVTFAKATYDDEPEKNDMIYFANTSLTKKTKLREIFRKTTRYIDRVTSLQ